MHDPGLRYQYAPPYSPQRTDPDYQKNWEKSPEHYPPIDDTLLGPFRMASAGQQFAQEGFPNFVPLGTTMPPGGGTSIPRTRYYDMPYLYTDVPKGPPQPPQLSVQQQATDAWNKAHKDLIDQFVHAQVGTPEGDRLYQQYMAAQATRPPDPTLSQLKRSTEQSLNVKPDVAAMQQGMQYGPGPVRGQLHLLPQYQNLGNIRPFGPGEWINRVNPDGSTGWSSEETTTTRFSNGKWAVVPTLWMVNGVPMTLDEQIATQYAEQSGLNWPMFNSEAEANAWSDQREQRWQQVPMGRSDMQPPLWSRQWPSNQQGQ